jgi:hypothetical protein
MKRFGLLGKNIAGTEREKTIAWRGGRIRWTIVIARGGTNY